MLAKICDSGGKMVDSGVLYSLRRPGSGADRGQIAVYALARRKESGMKISGWELKSRTPEVIGPIFFVNKSKTHPPNSRYNRLTTHRSRQSTRRT